MIWQSGESWYLGISLPSFGGMMILPAKIRAIRAHLKENQSDFGARFSETRYTVLHWEKYGIAGNTALEQRILALEGLHDDKNRQASE